MFASERSLFETESAMFALEGPLFDPKEPLSSCEGPLFALEHALFGFEGPMFCFEEAMFDLEQAMFGLEPPLSPPGRPLFSRGGVRRQAGRMTRKSASGICRRDHITCSIAAIVMKRFSAMTIDLARFSRADPYSAPELTPILPPLS